MTDKKEHYQLHRLFGESLTVAMLKLLAVGYIQFDYQPNNAASNRHDTAHCPSQLLLFFPHSILAVSHTSS